MKFGEEMGKKHKVVKRLVIISAVLLSLVLSSRAQTVTSSEDDISPEIVCIPGTNNCKTPHKDSVITRLSPSDGASKLKPSNICDPITKLCQGPHRASFAASGKEDQNAGASDQSKYESAENSQSQTSKGFERNPEIICTVPSGDRDCKGPPPPNSFVSESGEDDAYADSQLSEESEYEHSTEASTSKHHKHKPTNLRACSGPPDHRVCTGPTHGSFVSDDASRDSQSSEESESDSEADTSNGHEPTPPNGRMGCTGQPGKDIDCPDPHQSSVTKSDGEAFAINIHQLQEGAINPLVCHPSADGTTCEGPHQAFGIAQPRVEAA